MKRITFDGNFCDIAACMEVPGGSWCEGVMCSQRAVWERLKAIEDVLGDEYDLDRLRMAVAVQSMTPNEYQQLCLRTINQDTPSDQLLINCALGLCGEAGEVSDIIKKYLFQGHPLNADKIADELGDVGWYHAVMAWALGIPLEDIMQANVDKMRRRYPDGFDPERSIHRKIEADAQTDTTPDTSDSTTTDAQPEDDPVAHAIYRTICGRG